MAYEESAYKKWSLQTSWEAPSLKAKVSARIKKVHHGDGGLTTQATRTNKEEKIMKKMVALVLAGTMMAGMASVASATKNFDTPVWCNSTTN